MFTHTFTIIVITFNHQDRPNTSSSLSAASAIENISYAYSFGQGISFEKNGAIFLRLYYKFDWDA